MLLVVTSTHRKHTMLKQAHQKYRAAVPVGLLNLTWPDAVLTLAPIWLSESTNPTDAEQS